MAGEDGARLAWVTGGAQGIGAAIVARLLGQGLRVLAIDRDEAGLSSLTRSHSGAALETHVFDLSDIAATPQMLELLVGQHGTPTRLALNAGVWPGGPIINMSDDVWNLNLAVNVTSPFTFLRGLAPVMAAAGGGAVVYTASRNAHRSSTGNAAYDASKAALLGLMRTAAGEFASLGIRVNAVSPGVVSTPSISYIEEPRYRAAYLKQVPMNRYGTADEIAGVCAFLLSDDAGFVTGQDIIVDGGQIACQDNSRMFEGEPE
jgi:NAD(P)-dependent dehydrogenase (short-subunit alcohol dehydrogenase family)